MADKKKLKKNPFQWHIMEYAESHDISGIYEKSLFYKDRIQFFLQGQNQKYPILKGVKHY